ncbi:MAG TPA: radical SAM protein [Acidimicrobiia bacterium]
MGSHIRWRTAGEEPQETLFEGLVRREVGIGEYRGLEFYEVQARTIINRVPGAPFGFEYSINAYRGCSHACTYCFARPSHEYLGLGPGTDFETKIVVKTNAIELARAETSPSRWGGELIAMGTNTDPYQPAEGRYKLTRGIVGVLIERANPFSILTKSTLVLRDLDLLIDAAQSMDVRVDFSIGTLDESVWRTTEPGTPHPRRRVEAVARLSQAGVPSGVLVAPVLPGLSDRSDQIEAVVAAAVEAGAVSISSVLLHLRDGVKQHYRGWLETARPDLVSLYDGLYGRGPYAPPRSRARLASLVAELVEKHGGPVRSFRERPKPRPGAKQLALGL